MDLLHKQFIFAGLFARLILYAFQQGRKVKILQVLRSKEEAARLAALGLGIVDSIHCDGIAGDLAIISDDDVEVSDTSISILRGILGIALRSRQRHHLRLGW